METFNTRRVAGPLLGFGGAGRTGGDFDPGVFGTGIAYVIKYRLLANRGALGAALVTYLIPMVAVLTGALTLSERIRLNVVVGVGVVLTGVGLIRSASR